MSTLGAIALSLLLGLVCVVALVVKQAINQVLTNEMDWWAPRLEALLARFPALLAPPRSDRKALRDTWLAELEIDRAPGATRVLKAGALVGAAISMWRRLPPFEDPVVEVQAADGAKLVGAPVVREIEVAIHGTGDVAANVEVGHTVSAAVGVREAVNYRRSVTETLPTASDRWSHTASAVGPGQGGGSATLGGGGTGAASTGHGGMTASLGPPGLRVDGMARVAGSANLGPGDLRAHAVLKVDASARFHPDVMERLRRRDYPVVDRKLYQH